MGQAASPFNTHFKLQTQLLQAITAGPAALGSFQKTLEQVVNADGLATGDCGQQCAQDW